MPFGPVAAPPRPSMLQSMHRILHRPISELHPWLHAVRVEELRAERRISDRLRRVRFARTVSRDQLPISIVRHASILTRPLRDLDPALQESKIVNLSLAARSIDGLVVRPGETFSLWERVGPPTAGRGFVDGLILRGGRITAGTGGGLCQLSNLLHWMALHSPLTVVEQHHHGFDPFPDAGRVLPFGSGATIFYNYGDLRLQNRTDQPFQLVIRVGPTRLHGAIRTDRAWAFAYHVESEDDRFVREPDGRVFRENALWRRVVDRATGRTVERTLLRRNHALVAYPVDDSQIALDRTAGGGAAARGFAPAEDGTPAGASLPADGSLRAR